MTTTTTAETILLKTDVKGRVRMPAERREAILDAFEQSGMSGQAFARHIGVKYPTFASWVQKRRRQRSQCAVAETADNSSGITFVEAKIATSTETSLPPLSPVSALEVEAPGGLRLHVHSKTEVALAAELIRALTPLQSC